jgi:hypothetical protein
MNKSIFVALVIGALAISLLASAVLANEADASKRNIIKERANNVLDKHIDAGGAHGEAGQRIKDRLNACCPLCGCG